MDNDNFIVTPYGLKISKRFLAFNSELKTYHDTTKKFKELYPLVSIIEKLLTGDSNKSSKHHKILIDCKSIDIHNDGYLLTHNGKCKLKIGKLVIKINDNKRDNISKIIVEQFVDYYKSWCTINNDSGLRFETYTGNDILKGYNIRYYKNPLQHNMLNTSCMNGKKELLDIYTHNSEVVSLLVLVDNSNKIHGRALVWQLNNGSGVYMDRIYGTDNFITCIFQDHAIKNKWMFRSQHAAYRYSLCIYDKKTETHQIVDSTNVRLEVSVKLDGIILYPYMDSLFILNQKKCTLSNIKKRFTKNRLLRTTNGDSYSENRMF